MLFWCLDLPVSSPTLAVPVEWFSLSLRENELGLEPLLVAWYHDLSPFLSHDKARDLTADIPSHDSERVERYQLPGQPRPEGFSLKALADDEGGSLGRLFNLPMFSWLIPVCICLSRRRLPPYYGYTVWNAMQDRCEDELTPPVIDDINGDHVCD